jgi:hypothetical protein
MVAAENMSRLHRHRTGTVAFWNLVMAMSIAKYSPAASTCITWKGA